ncbi:MAG: class I SAM-dependent methyltransferase [Acidimicrobiales bacterium]
MDHRSRDLARQTAEYYPDAEFEWLDDLKVRCKGATLCLTQGFNLRQADGETILFKDPLFLGAYLELLKGRTIKNMVEVGVFTGGSAIFFWNLLKPVQLCCIDINTAADRLTDYIRDQELHDSISTYFGTDQSDRPRMNEILDEQFGSEPVDLVIDDASHLYGPSLATFEVMFPRLPPGALYILEDWKVHLEFAHGRDAEAKEPPLHRLVQDLVDVAIVSRETISDVVLHHNFAVFTRGEGEIDPDAFSVATILDSAREQLER